LVQQKLLERPLLDVLRLVLLELTNVLDGALQDRALVLFAVWDNLGKFVNAFVDGFASTALNLLVLDARQIRIYVGNLPSLWLSRRILCHSSDPTGGFPAPRRPPGISSTGPGPAFKNASLKLAPGLTLSEREESSPPVEGVS
jgi:hypothetical protein